MYAGARDASGCDWEGCRKVSTGGLNIDEEQKDYCHEHYWIVHEKYFPKNKVIKCDFQTTGG